MNCKDIEENIAAYLDNKLSEKESQSLECHLDSCKSCSVVLNETKKLLSLLDKPELEIPSENLDENIFNLLNAEKRQQAKKVMPERSNLNLIWRQVFRVAAVFLLLFTGYMSGSYSSKKNSSQELSHLQDQTLVLKEDMVLAMLGNKSTSKRIQGISQSEVWEQPDLKIIEAIIDRMQHDVSIAVRLTATKALSKYYTIEMVKNAFLETLKTENNPDLQITIIQYLVAINDERAVIPIQKILDDPDTPDYIKTLAYL